MNIACRMQLRLQAQSIFLRSFSLFDSGVKRENEVKEKT